MNGFVLFGQYERTMAKVCEKCKKCLPGLKKGKLSEVDKLIERSKTSCHCLCFDYPIKEECEINDWTALTLAAKKGHYQCVKSLLQGGAEVNEMAEDGYTALMKTNLKNFYLLYKHVLTTWLSKVN